MWTHVLKQLPGIVLVLWSIKFKLFICPHVSKEKNMCFSHMYKGLQPSYYDSHSGIVSVALCGHHFSALPCLLFAFCFHQLIMLLRSMAALTLSTGDLSLLKIMG